ncbi:MAG: hypothetical protein J1F22_01055 [Lachnospiraceae bacterium]|nr:hypothetical protein [Lachnospiraceae bacterium]
MSKNAANGKSKKKRKMPLSIKWLFFLFILSGIAFMVFYFYMHRQTNPNRIVRQYVETFMSKDTSALFNQLGFTESAFSTPETLKTSLEELHKYSTLTSYSLVQYESTNPDLIQYSIEYGNNSRGGTFNQTLTLKKSPNKLYFLFDNWEIDTTDFVAKDCSLGVPAGATVYMDSKELTPDSARTPEEKSGNLLLYPLGDMFPGTHTIKVSMEGFNDYTTSFYLKNGNYENQNIYTVTPSLLSITEESKKERLREAEKLVKSIYETALSEKPFDKITQKYTFENSEKDRLAQAYNAIVTNHIKSATHLTKVSFTSFDANTAVTYAEDGCYAIKVTADMDYTADSVVVKGASSTDSASGTAPGQSKSTSGSSLFTTIFHYKDGVWSIFDTTALDTCIYYIKY